MPGSGPECLFDFRLPPQLVPDMSGKPIPGVPLVASDGIRNRDVIRDSTGKAASFGRKSINSTVGVHRLPSQGC